MSKQNLQKYFDYFYNEEEEIEDNSKTGSEYFNQRNSQINSDKEINDNKRNEEGKKNDLENLYESIEVDDENEENEENENDKEKENENYYNDDNNENIYSSEESFKPTKPPSKSFLNNENLTISKNSIKNEINNDDDDSFLVEQEKKREERLKREKEEEKINKLNEKNEKIKESLKKKKEIIEEMMKKKKEKNLNELNNIKNDNNINNISNNNDKLNLDFQTDESNNNTSFSNNYNLEQKKEKLELLVKQKQEEKKKLEEEKKKNKNYGNSLKNNNINNNENNSLKNSELKNKISEKNSTNSLINMNPFEYDNEPKIKNNIYSINSQFKNDLNQSQISFSDKPKYQKKYSKNTNKSIFKPVLYNKNNQFTFHPKINNNSKTIVNQMIKKSNTYRTLNKSIDNILYEDAKRKKNKLQKLKDDKFNEAYLNSSKPKINSASQNFAIRNLEKKIEKTVKLYEKNNQISFIGMAKVLYDLKIFKEILKKDDYYNNQNNDMNDEEILEAIKNKYNHRKRNDDNNENGISIETEVLEQIWFLLNISNEDYIDSDIFINFLNIIFSPVKTSIKNVVDILNKYIQAALFMHNVSNRNTETSINNEYSNNNLISKITGNYLSYQDKWELEKIVKKFWILKKNRIAHITTHNLSESVEKDLKEKNNNLTFQPNYDSNNNIKKVNFLKKLKKYEEEERLKQITLRKARKIKLEEELQTLQSKPNIEISQKATKKYEYMNSERYKNIHNQLYNDALKKKFDKEEKIKENEKKIREKELMLTNIPKISHSINLNKSFDAKQNIKGYGKYIERIRKGILKRKLQDYQLKKIPLGEKYEEEKNKIIKPFNITDLQKVNKKEKERLMKKYLNKTNSCNESNSNDESDGTTPYITLDIKLLNKKNIKINVYMNDDPNEVAKKIGKNYGVNDDIIKKLSDYIKSFQDQFFKNNNDDDIISS